MAVVKSSLIEAIEGASSGGVQTKEAGRNDAALAFGRKHGIVGSVAVTTDEAIGTIYQLCPLHGNWRVVSLVLIGDEATAEYDVGLYDDEGNVVDVDAYGSGVVMDAAASGLDVAFEARSRDKMGQDVFADAGENPDNGKTYYLALTSVTGAAAGDSIIAFDVTVQTD